MQFIEQHLEQNVKNLNDLNSQETQRIYQYKPLLCNLKQKLGSFRWFFTVIEKSCKCLHYMKIHYLQEPKKLSVIKFCAKSLKRNY